jgi:putative ABC transport system substrate-binding protein
MNNRRKLIVALGAGALVAPFASLAQQPGKIYRIGYLGLSSPSTFALQMDALRTGLSDFGYVEGKNLVIEYRWAEGKYERLPELAAELVKLNIEVLVTTGTPGTIAAKGATVTIPIVMTTSGDAVGAGLVASLARPGGNVTGSTFFVPELMAKRIELIKEAIPRAKRIAVLQNADDLSNIPVRKAMDATAKALKVDLPKFEVRAVSEFEDAFAAMAKGRVDGVVVQEEALLSSNTKSIAEHAAKHRIFSASAPAFADAGCAIGYGVNSFNLYRRTGYFVDKLLKGAKPADIPVERPTRFEVIINLKTAKSLGVKIPGSILVRADKVIE